MQVKYLRASIVTELLSSPKHYNDLMSDGLIRCRFTVPNSEGFADAAGAGLWHEHLDGKY